MTTETKRYRLTYGKGRKFAQEVTGKELFDSRNEAYDFLKADESKWTWYELATHDDEGTWRQVDVQRPE